MDMIILVFPVIASHHEYIPCSPPPEPLLWVFIPLYMTYSLPPPTTQVSPWPIFIEIDQFDYFTFMLNNLFCWIHSPTIAIDVPSFISCILFLPLSYPVKHSLHGYYRPHFHNLNTWSLSSLHLYLHLLLPIDIWYSLLTPLPSPSYTGTLPPQWSNMTSMIDLRLSLNQLTGKW